MICLSDFVRKTPLEIRELRIILAPIHMLLPEYDPTLLLKNLSEQITAAKAEIYIHYFGVMN